MKITERALSDAKKPGVIARLFHSGITAWVVLSVSLLITLAGWTISSAYVDNRAADRFRYEIDSTVDAIAKRMQEYEQVLRGGVGLFQASDDISRSDWNRYVSTLLIDTYWPGIQGIGYAEMIQPAELAAHEARIRAEGFRNYRVSPGYEREVYSAIVYLEPFSGRNLRAFGYDMYSEPVRREAMQRAADTGQPALSGRVVLVQETDRDIQAGFLVYLPLYHRDMPLASREERRAALRGFVYSPFRIKDLLQGILGPGRPVLDYQVYDGSGTRPEQLLYDSRLAFSDPADGEGQFAATRMIELQGRTWTVQLHSRASFDAHLRSTQPTIIAIGGLVVDVLLFTVIMSLARHRRQVSAHAANLARVLEELRASELLLKRTHEVAKVGSWQLDARNDNRLDWSDETYRIFGLSPGAPIDYQRFLSIVHPDDRLNIDTAWQAALGGLPYDIEHRILIGEEVRWVNERAEFHFSEDHDVVLVQGSVQDITSRKRSEQALLLARRVFEHAREGIMITDAQANMIDVNPMFTEITGYTRAEVIHRNPRILASGKHDGEFYTRMWETLNKTGSWQGEIWNRRKDGQPFLERISISAVTDPANHEVMNYIGLFSDATEVRRQQERMQYLAHHDTLTGLPNRYLLMDRLRVAIARAERHDLMLTLAFIDLDEFKPVNDRFGHATGDKVLIEVGRRLQSGLRKEDTVARLGGDEFALLYSDQRKAGEVKSYIDRLQDALAEPYLIEGNTLRLSASIGVAMFPEHAADADLLLRAADGAMYEAKRAGRNRSYFLPTNAG